MDRRKFLLSFSGGVLVAIAFPTRAHMDFSFSRNSANRKGSSRIDPRYTVEKPSTHQILTWRGLNELDGVSDQTKAFAWQNVNARLDDLCLAEFTPHYDDIITGSGNADRGKMPLCPTDDEPRIGFVERVVSNWGKNSFFEHFWNPDDLFAGAYYGGGPIAENGWYNQGLNAVHIFPIVDPVRGHYDSAFRFAENIWTEFVLPLILGGDADEGYYYFGEVLHLIEDMAVPAHVHLVSHDRISGRDSYELLFRQNPNLLFQKYPDIFDKAYRVNTLPNMEGFDWGSVFHGGTEPSELFKLFWYVAQKTQYWAVRTERERQRGNSGYRTSVGEWREFRPSLWQGEEIRPIRNPARLGPMGLQREARVLIAHAMRAVAGTAIRLQEDLAKYTLSWRSSGVLPSGQRVEIQNDLSVPVNFATANVRVNGGDAMEIENAVASGFLDDQVEEFHNGIWRTFHIHAYEWRLRPGGTYRIRALKSGVELFWRAVTDYPRTTDVFEPLP